MRQRILSTVLCLALVLGLAAPALAVGNASGEPTSVEKVTFTLTKAKGGDSFPANVSGVTANLFYLENNYSKQTEIHIEFPTLPAGADFKLRINGSAAQSLSSGYTNYLLPTATKGSLDLNLVLCDSSSAESDTVQYTGTVSTYLTDTAPTLVQLNPTTDLKYMENLSPYVDFYLPKGAETEKITIKLVEHGAAKVVALSDRKTNIPTAQDTTQNDTRYEAIFTKSFRPQCNARRIYTSLLSLCPMEHGKKYDLRVFFGEPAQPNYTLENAIEASNMPVVTNLYASQEQPGSQKVKVNLSYEYDSFVDFTITVKDGNTVIGTAVPADLRHTSAYYAFANINLNQALENGKTYTIEASATPEFVGIKSATLRPYKEARAVDSIYVADGTKAHALLYTSGYSNGAAYKAILIDYYKNTELASYVTHCVDGVFDLEFRDKDGAVLALTPDNGYRFEIRGRSNGADWDAHGNSQLYFARSNSTDTEFYGFCDFQSNLISGNVNVPKSMVDPITDTSKLSIQIVGLDDQTYDVITAVEKKDYSNDTSTPWSAFYTLTGTAPQALPHGCYHFRVLYDGAELKKPNSAENLFATGYTSTYSGAKISASYYRSLTTGGYAEVCPGVFVYGLDGSSHTVKAKLYPSVQGGAPITVPLTRDATATNQYLFTAVNVQAANLDLARLYNGTILVDGKISGTIGNTYVCPDDLPTLDTTYTAAISQQPVHGTLAVSTASGKVGTAVYVLSTPEQGYELKPGSVKVNGKSIMGRGFLLTENATVTAEFEPVFVPKYHVSLYNTPTGGTLTFDKNSYLAGETVHFTSTPEAGNVLYSLYWYVGGNGSGAPKTVLLSHSFVMPQADVRLSPSFSTADDNTLTVDYGPNPTGTILINGVAFEPYNTHMKIKRDALVTVTAASGYSLVGLTGKDSADEIYDLSGFTFYMHHALTIYPVLAEGAQKTPTVVTVTHGDGVYGGTLPDAVKSAANTGANGAWTLLYKGREGTVYTESSTKPTEPGKYTVTATYEDDTYRGSGTADFIIEKATATVTATATGKTYDGTAVTVGASNTGDGTEYTYTYATAQAGSYTNTVPTDAGTYWVKASVAATDHYKSTESTPASYTITAKGLTGETVAITGVESSYTATGSAITPVPVVTYNSTTLIEGADKDYTLTYEANTAIGDSAKVNISFRGNYSGSKSVTFAIVALPVQTVTFTSPTVEAKAYGDAPFSNVATSNGAGAISYQSSNANVAAVDASGQVTITGAGTATITATAAEVANTWAQGTASYTLTATPAALTVTGLAATNRAFDGTKNVALTGGALNGILNSDDVVAAMPTNGTVESADAGDNKAVTVSTITLTGAEKDNYTVTQPQGVTVSITKAAAPVIATVNKTYACASAHANETVNLAALLPANRGSEAFAIGNVTDANSILDGVPSVGQELLTFSVKAGLGEQTATIPVNVTGMANYEDTTITVTINLVEKTEVTITGVSVTDKTYDGTAVAPTGTPVAVGYTGQFEYAYSGTNGTVYTSANAPKDAGQYTLTVKVPDADTEHMGTTAALPFIIEKAALTVKPADKSIYVGDALPSAFELSYTGFASGEDKSVLTITGTPEYALKNGANALENSNTAGTYTIAWTNQDGVVITADNYAVTKADGGLTISGRPSTGGSTDGGSTPSKPITNPDGSTTTTTKNPDGSTTAVTEGKEGDKVTETTTKSGTTITATVPVGQNTTATVSSTIKADTKDGAVKAAVPAKDVDALIKAATDNKVGTITIAPDVKSGTDVTSATVSFPAEVAAKLGKAADVAVATPVGTVTLPAAALAELGTGKEAVSVMLEAKANATFSFALKAGDKALDAVKGGVKVSLPATKATPGTVAVLVLPDGTELIIRKSVAGADGVLALLDGSATVKLVDNSKQFTDVPAENWAADGVAFASSHGLFQGVSDKAFAPDMAVNRGMFATVLNRLENEVKGETSANFGDVDGTAYYANAVAWASENGIVAGTGAGFAPDAGINRESMSVMLYRYADVLGYDTSAKGDVGQGVSSWATDAMSWAVGSGLLKGDGSGNLNPAASATRAETAIILQRFVEGLVK